VAARELAESTLPYPAGVRRSDQAQCSWEACAEKRCPSAEPSTPTHAASETSNIPMTYSCSMAFSTLSATPAALTPGRCTHCTRHGAPGDKKRDSRDRRIKLMRRERERVHVESVSGWFTIVSQSVLSFPLFLKQFNGGYLVTQFEPFEPQPESNIIQPS
jgi:hypothetical protein